MFNVKKISIIGMLCAIAYVVMVFGWIPVVLFLKYDPKDVIITIGGFLLDPLSAFIISVIVSFIEMLSVSETGITVFMGGVFVEACPEECLKHADSVILCEVEQIWKNILADYFSGNYKQRYELSERPAIAGLPLPRHDLVKNPKYLTNNLIMISKGCLNRCQFCSGGSHWKGQVKTKNIDDVIKEIQSLDMNEPYFILDDNLVWNAEFAK